MTWNPLYISDRRTRRGRDRRVDTHQRMRFSIGQRWFKDLVAVIDDAMPVQRTGRPRRHSVVSGAFIYLMSLSMSSQAEAEEYLRSGTNWNGFRRLLATEFPDDPLLAYGAPPPTKSLLRHIKSHLGEEQAEKIATILHAAAFLHAKEMSIGVNRGTMLNPGLEAGMYGDGVVIRPMTKYKRGDLGFNHRERYFQERRHDPDASYHYDGLNRRVYGNVFAHMSAWTGIPSEHITFGIRPIRKGSDVTEAQIALGFARDIKEELPGMAMLHWDKALRGKTVEEIWDMEMMPMIGVYNKAGRTTEQVSLGKKKINGIETAIFAYRGAVSIKAIDGSFIPLRAVKLAYQHNAKSTCRVYCDYIVPEGSHCDVRLWNGKVNQRLNSPEKADFTFGEHIRAHAPGSPDWKNLYGNRSLAESLNSLIKNDLGRGERARSLNLNHQWIDLMLMLLMRNDHSLVLYRRRTQLARTASPPAA